MSISAIHCVENFKYFTQNIAKKILTAKTYIDYFFQ